MRLPGTNHAIKPKRRREIYENVASISRPSGSYYVMMALATVIAAYGLLMDSPAVVIGAMLVAPLMGPIFGIALGLTSGSRRLIWSALQSAAYGVIVSLIIAMVIGLMPFLPAISEEWLVRTRPTLHDLLVALAAGFGGAYALIDERVSASLPGVAIAVAVLPPLAACGLSISTGRWSMAGGAMMLFVANFFAIQIASAIVFSLFGMLRGGQDRIEEKENGGLSHFLRRFWISFAVLGVMAWFMTSTLIAITTQQHLSSTINIVLSEQVGTMMGARLSDFDFGRDEDRLRITAQVLTPRPFQPADVASVEQKLEEAVDDEVHLIIRSLISRDVDSEGAVFATADELRQEVEEERRVEFMSTASRVVAEHIERMPGAGLMDLRSGRANGKIKLTALVEAPEALTPEKVAQVEEDLSEALDISLDLVVRKILTRDTARSGHLYDEPEALPPAQEALISTARAVLQGWVADNAPTVELIDIELDASEETWALLVHMLSPEPVTEQQATEMQRELDGELPRETRLRVRYSFGGEAEPTEAVRDAP